MTNISMIRYFLIFAFLFVNCGLCGIKPDSSEAFISLILGQVSIQKSNADQWSPAKINQAVGPVDKIRCEKKSRCEIKIGPKKILRVGELSSIIIKEQINQPEIEVKRGRIWLNIILEGEKLNLRTPTSVASIRGTVYRADASDNASQFRVYEGEVGISPLDENGDILDDSTFIISPGQEFVIANDAKKFIEQDKQMRSQYLEDQKSQFEEFMRQDAQKQAAFKAIDQKDFEAFKSYQVLKRAFDPDLDQKDEWVKWNKELDQAVTR